MGNNSVVSTQPAAFVNTRAVPLTEIGLLVGGLGVLFGICCLYFDRRYRQYLLMFYLSPRALRRANQVFERYSVDSLVLDRNTCFKALHEFERTDEFCRDAVDRAMTLYRERFGSKQVTAKKFVDLIMLLIGGGYLKVIKDTPFARSEPFRPPLTLVNLRSLDFFKYRHHESIGGTITRRKTTLGGVVSLAFYFVVIVYVTLQITQFRFNNVVETRSVLPTMVLDSQPFAELSISVEISTDVGTCVDPRRQATCLPENVVILPRDHGVRVAETFNSSFKCIEPRPRVCRMTWSCGKCALSKPNTTLQFLFGSRRSYTADATIEASATTGIQDQKSSTSFRFSVADAALVFRGFPSTWATVSMLKTSFEDSVSYTLPKDERSDGYHVHFELERLAEGNTVDARSFALYTGLPITVTMQLQDVSLLVSRKLKQSPLDLISALLGGFSGLAGAVVVVMRTVEMFAERAERKKIAARMPALRKKRALSRRRSAVGAVLNQQQQQQQTRSNEGVLTELETLLGESMLSGSPRDWKPSAFEPLLIVKETTEASSIGDEVGAPDGADGDDDIPVFRESAGLLVTLDEMH